jgi:hypothetical protein
MGLDVVLFPLSTPKKESDKTNQKWPSYAWIKFLDDYLENWWYTTESNYFAATNELNSAGDVVLAAPEKGVTAWDECMLIIHSV